MAANVAVTPPNGRLIAGHSLCNLEGGPQQYRGQLDEIKMFGVALTAAEVLADMSPPKLNIAALPGGVRLTWTTNSTGFVLESNNSVVLANGRAHIELQHHRNKLRIDEQHRRLGSVLSVAQALNQTRVNAKPQRPFTL